MPRHEGAWGAAWGCWRLLGGQDGGLREPQKEVLKIQGATESPQRHQKSAQEAPKPQPLLAPWGFGVQALWAYHIAFLIQQRLKNAFVKWTLVASYSKDRRWPLPLKAECSILERYVVGGKWLVRCSKMQTSTFCGHRLSFEYNRLIAHMMKGYLSLRITTNAIR